jgi:hypothetical protein
MSRLRKGGQIDLMIVLDNWRWMSVATLSHSYEREFVHQLTQLILERETCRLAETDGYMDFSSMPGCGNAKKK